MNKILQLVNQYRTAIKHITVAVACLHVTTAFAAISIQISSDFIEKIIWNGLAMLAAFTAGILCTLLLFLWSASRLKARMERL